MANPHVTDLTGTRSHHLQVIGKGPRNQGTDCRRALWLCLCDCGRICLKETKVIRKGIAKTCSHKQCKYYIGLLRRSPLKLEAKVAWDLSSEDILALQEAASWECHLCGEPTEARTGGIIRKFRTAGYTPTNSLWVCTHCCLAYLAVKRDIHEWIDLCKKTTERHCSHLFE